MSLVLEKDIEKYLVTQVKKCSGLCYKWLSTVTGVPDRIVILCGTCYFVELKTATGVLSARQKLVFSQLSEHNQPVFVLRTYEDVDDFITFATQSTATIPTTYGTNGLYHYVYGLVYGAGAGQDGDGADDHSGAVQGKDTRGRAKARRGKRVDGRG